MGFKGVIAFCFITLTVNAVHEKVQAWNSPKWGGTWLVSHAKLASRLRMLQTNEVAANSKLVISMVFRSGKCVLMVNVVAANLYQSFMIYDQTCISTCKSQHCFLSHCSRIILHVLLQRSPTLVKYL